MSNLTSAATDLSERADEYPLTFTPIDIGSVQLPNRVVRTAHFTAFAFGAPSQDLINYHLARAQGGVGLSFLEATAVHSSSMLGLAALDDSVIGETARFMDAIRPTGMKVFSQLFHGGNHYAPPGGLPTRGVTALPSPEDGFPAVPFSTQEVVEVVESFASATRRLAEAGVDGVEVHSGHGYLPEQFLSPVINRRTDEYGGSFENRMRFLVEVMRSVRSAAGGMPVGVRVSAPVDSSQAAELEFVLKLLETEGLTDFVNISIGNSDAPSAMLAGSEKPHGYQLPLTGPLSSAMSTPTIVTGRFRTLTQVEEVLRSGTADLVSMVRAHIADPHIVSKTRSGHPEQIRPCIGCNQGCLGRVSGVDMRMGCTVNPAVGFEGTLSEELVGTTDKPLRVVVVGGGPAGMEAARMARLRGHEVSLYEARSELGGALLEARHAPFFGEIFDIAEWQARELLRLGVKVYLNTTIELQQLRDFEADETIIAAGAAENQSGRLIAAPWAPVAGLDRPHVITAAELLSAPIETIGHDVVVYDDMGQYEAISAVDHLLKHGRNVTVATRLPAFAEPLEFSLRADAAMERFYSLPGTVQFLPRHTVAAVDETTCVLRPIHDRTGRTDHDIVASAQTVVLITYRESRRELADGLLAEGHQVHVVGDALSPRDLQTAIRQGHLAGRGIA